MVLDCSMRRKEVVLRQKRGVKRGHFRASALQGERALRARQAPRARARAAELSLQRPDERLER